MRVMGIDPGLTRTGYAVVEESGARSTALVCGTVRARDDRTAPEQLADLRRALAEVIETWQPESVAVERVFVNQNRRTAVRVLQASGAALVAVAEAGLPVFEYTPSEVKRAVVGVGTASKEQIAYMVRAILGPKARPDSPDAADALALALCHLSGARLRIAAGRHPARRAAP